ncbi:MAG: ATPase [Ilumatobacteraceae bacterium]|nr:ATPase [Ilumatobacteraceae bacterium]
MLKVGLLGPVELRRDGERIALPGGKTTELLVRLALEAGRTVGTERLIDDLWGDDGVGTAKNTLQSKVSQLRRALGDPALVRGGASGYSLALDPSAVDAIEVCRLAELTSTLLAAGDSGEAFRASSAALEMFRGETLVDAGEAEWMRPHRARLVEVHGQLIEDAIEARLDMGAAAELIGELEALVQFHPLRERIRGQLMVALYRAGRQADALRAYQAARTVLGDELGLEPSRELQRLEAAILAQDPALDLPERPREEHEARSDARTGNLPAAVSSFIGRTTELGELSRLVAARRLITLVGPGGAGMTRLAVEVGEQVRSDFADGVWFIEFAPLKSGSDVSAAVATALGLDDSDRLRTYVSQRRMLLLFDNCEHVLDDAAAVAATLLGAGPGVTIVATSRERLGAAGEMLYPVQSLDVDDAAELFVERARAGGLPSDALAQTDAIARICDQLDRMPLALELAAARTRSLSLGEIVERVDDRFALLTGGDRTAAVRHQTLRGVVDWSYELLFSAEQRVFRYVSIFAGGFDLHAAESVCAGGETATADIIDLLGNLVDKSLVTVSHRDGTIRYTMLQTLMDYGRQRLVDAGEDADARDRHLRWMVQLAIAAESGLRTSAQLQWVERARHERDNIRASMAWAVEQGNAADAIAIVAGFGYAWYIGGSIKEGLASITQALAIDGEVPVDGLATAHAWAGWMTQLIHGATPEAVDHVERALVIGRSASVRTFCLATVYASILRAFRGLGSEAVSAVDEADARLDVEPDRWAGAWIDWVRSGLVNKAGDPAAAAELLRKSLAASTAEGDQCAAAIAAIRLGELAELRGDHAEATAATMNAYTALTSTGSNSFNASMLATRLGNLAALQGRFEEAATWHERGLSRARDNELPGAIAQAFSGMGEAARLAGDPAAANAYHREALARFETTGSIEGAVFSLTCLGLIATTNGDPPGAIELLTAGLVRATASSDRRGVAMAVEGLADAHAILGDALSAARILGAADALRDEIGGAPPLLQRGCVGRAESAARSALEGDVYEAEHARGRADAHSVVAALVSGEPV